MKPLDAAEFSMTLTLADEAATAELAQSLSLQAKAGDVIALSGDLGAGKTSFARAFINALPREKGAADPGSPEEVPSPTFTLVQLYERAAGQVWHFDLYRLEQAEEAYELGIEEAFSEGISLIEWPERLGGLLPRDRLELRLGFAALPQSRTAEFRAEGSWKARLETLAQALGPGAQRA